MKTVRPKPLAVPMSSLKLTPEEGFVLSRIDGRLSVRDLVALTGIEEPRVEQIVTKLASNGAVVLDTVDGSSGYLPDPGSDPALGASSRLDRAKRVAPPPEDGTTSLAEFAAVLGMDPTSFAAHHAPAAVEAPVDEHRVETKSGVPPPADDAAEASSEVLRAASAKDEEAASGMQLAAAEAPPSETDEDAEAAEAAAADEPETSAEAENNYRQIYETRYHPLPTDARVHAAQTAQGADLCALCFDADPRVIVAVLQNPTSGLSHARLVAFHHRNGTGLEMLARRMELLRDVMVERRLLRNPQCGEQVLSRIMATKRLLQTYKIAIDRDIPELTRARSRGYIRQKFQQAPPEERADLVVRTEGRCLAVMTGCTFDAKTTAILVGRPYNSVLFIQNLAKFPATPPALLAHLVKQPFVRKIAPLKKLLLQHPNMPGEVKRQL